MAETVRYRRQITVEEYLAFEETATVRHEYVGGEVHAMTGASGRHNRISSNISSLLWNAARGGPCRVFQSDMKVRVSEDTIYYPDVLVACDAPPDDPYYVEPNPCLVVEVVSPSTERIDRREKLAAYRKLESVGAYFVVSQDERRVERHFPGTDGVWRREDVTEDGGVIEIPCPDGARLTLAEVYEGVDV